MILRQQNAENLVAVLANDRKARVTGFDDHAERLIKILPDIDDDHL